MRRSGGGGAPNGVPSMAAMDDIRDLDLEIQLLRRKRDIIEQQQQRMTYDDQRSYGYQQDQYNSSTNFSQLYDPPQYSSHIDDRSGFGNSKKRPQPKINPWASDGPSPAKRFHEPTKRYVAPPKRSSIQGASFPENPKRSRPRHRNSNPIQSPAAPPFSPIPKHARPGSSTRSERPRSSSKPKPGPSPNTYPIKEHKPVVNTAAKVEVDEQSLVLRADKDPTNLMVGRLEFVLGNILKDIKEFYAEPKYRIPFQSIQDQRAMKKCLRERIREVMLGKAVTHSDVILQAYREKYSIESDLDIIKVGLASAENSQPAALAKAVQKFGTDKDTVKGKISQAERYFYANVNRLIRKTLDEMIGKLREIYGVDTVALDNAVNVINDSIKASEESSKTNGGDASNGDGDTSSATGDASSATGDVSNATNNSNSTVDASNGAVDETNSSKMVEDKKDDIENTDITSEDKTKTDQAELREIFDNLLEKRITNKLLYILPQFKEVIANLINVNKSFNSEKAKIMLEANKIAEDPASDNSKNKTVSRDNSQVSEDSKPEIHYVRVLGKPSLPKKKLMQNFLDQFFPASIKKHKKVPHLLFIGLKTKEDVDKILAASNTIIGKSTIIIKPSANIAKVDDKKDNDVIFVADHDPAKEVIDIDNVINTELDDQITSLLDTIKQSEEFGSTDVSMDEHTENTNVTEANEVEPENKTETDAIEENQVVQNECEDKDDAANVESGNAEDAVENNDVQTAEVVDNDTVSNDIATETETNDENNAEETKDVVTDLKNEGPSTPSTRASVRLAATPSSIRTRRSSKLGQN